MSGLLERIRGEAREAEAKAREEHEAARLKLEASAAEVSAKAEEEGRTQSVSVFESYETPLTGIREQVAVEQKRQYLPEHGFGVLRRIKEEAKEIKYG